MIKIQKFYALLLILLSVTFASKTAAQKITLPSALNKNSTISEILDWLDETSFAKARIGISFDGFSSSSNPLVPSIPSAGAIYSPGFVRRKTGKQCEMVLRNEQSVTLSGGIGGALSVLDPLGDVRDANAKRLDRIISDGTVYPTEVGINLKRLSAKSGYQPRLLTGDSQIIKLFGAWRTQFKERSLLNAIDSAIYLPEKLGATDINDSIRVSGNKVTFTFDDEKTAGEFDRAFRRVIQLCRDSK